MEKLSTSLSKFIEENIHLIDDSNWVEELRRSTLILKEDNQKLIEIIKMLSGADNDAIKEYRLKAMAENLKLDVDYFLSQPKKTRLIDDPSEGWSRLSWLLMDINTLGLKDKEIIDYLLKHKNKYGFAMRKLGTIYNYADIGNSPDYDVAGVFDEEAFDKEYLEVNEETGEKTIKDLS